MSGEPDRRSPADTFTARRRDVERLCKWIAEELGPFAERPNGRGATWEDADLMDRARTKLKELLSTLSTLPADEIEYSLQNPK